MNALAVKDLRKFDSVPSDFLRRTEADLSAYLPRVQEIVAAVQKRGDDALVEFAQLFDKVNATYFRLRASEGRIRVGAGARIYGGQGVDSFRGG